MVSLNYKENVLKTLLYEKLSNNDVTENKNKLSNLKKRIDNSSSKDILIRDDPKTNTKFLYVFKSLSQKQPNKKCIPLTTVNSKGNKNYYLTCDEYELGQHGGIISDYNNEIIFNLTADSNAKYPNAFLNTKEQYFTKVISKLEISKYIDDEIKKIDAELKKNKVAKGSLFHSLKNDQINNLSTFTKKDYSTSEDTTPVNFDSSEKEKLFNIDRVKKTFTPENLIGDENYRSITSIQTKVQNSLIEYDKNMFKKYHKITPQLLVSAIIQDVVFDPYKTVDISPKLFDDKISQAFKGSYLEDLLKKNAGNNLLKDTTKDISAVRNLLLSDPNEIISAIALLQMKDIRWSQNSNGLSSKDEIIKVFGNENSFKNGVIMFPKNSNTALIDAVAMITSNGKGRQLGISTKGGWNGRGASASIASLFKFLFDDDTSIQFDKHGYNEEFSNGLLNASKKRDGIYSYIQSNIVPKLSTLGKSYWKAEPEKLAYLIIFGATYPIYHLDIIKNMVKFSFAGHHFKGNYQTTDLRSFAKQVSEIGITELVMDILDKQKYKFCQINTTPIFSGKQFRWTYAVQYPARFSGDVKLEKAANGLQFHIMGEVK